jgi:aminopeptidase N
MKQFLILAFTILLSQMHGQEDLQCRHFDEKGRTRERTVDFESMVLNLNFETANKKVLGEVVYQFKPIRKTIKQLLLDAPEITVEEVLLDGKICAFKSLETQLEITFNEELNWNTDYILKIVYSAQPEKGLYFLGWNDTTKRAREQIWTQGQGIDNRYWIPSFDDVSDKLITETFITFENGYEVISNGDLIEKIPASATTTTWHYKMQEPHVLYLVMIAIGDYAFYDLVSENGIVNRQYYYPDRPQDFAPTYQYSIDMMDWMEEEFGVPYPWGKIYRNVPVADFLYGAMENTSATIFTDFYLQDSRGVLERNYIGTNAHELTHQWFGDLITEWNSTSHWLHESFATHYAKHFRRVVEGEDEFNWERYQEMQRAISADNKNDIPVASSQAGSSRHYPKGSMVIDMLRLAAGGDEQYEKVVSNYLKKYSFKHVDTHLFQLEFMETLGLNLDWFFDQWIYKGGYPHFEVSYKILSDEIELNVKQIQEQNETIGLFKVQTTIHVGYTDGSSQFFTREVKEKEENFRLENPKKLKVAFVNFDWGNQIYKKLTFKRSLEELVAQASNPKSNMIDKYSAIKRMDNFEIDEKRNALLESYTNETFYATKAVIISQLIDDDHKKSTKLIQEALKDADPSVRRACIDNVMEISEKMTKDYEGLLQDSSYAIIEKALIKLCAQFPENSSNYLSIVEADAQRNELLNIAFLSIKGKMGDEEAIVKLVDYSSQSFEFRVRIKAMETLEAMDYKKKDFLVNLLNASVSFNKKLASQGRNTLLNLLNTAEEKYVLRILISIGEFDKNEIKLIEILKEQFEF